MPEELQDPVLIAFASGTMLLSLATCVLLFVARLRGPLLSFQPRKLVPWNVAGAVLACVFVLHVLATALANYTSTVPAESNPAAEQASDEPSQELVPAGEAASPTIILLNWLFQEVLIVGGVLFLIAVYFRASQSDLGLPANEHELARDIFIGLVAGVAVLAPTRIIQGVLLYWLGMPETKSGHQLVKILTENEPSVGAMLLATVATVIIAPLCEEITFRLLLQGWLEKWEATKVGCIGEPAPTSEGTEARPAMESGPIAVGGGLEHDEAPDKLAAPPFIETPPRNGIGGLPFGWLPIAASSLLFGLAHFGYGPEPVPLFFLALVLGYMYHRTHRIVPCMVAHAVFNLFTMAVLWRIVFHGAN